MLELPPNFILFAGALLALAVRGRIGNLIAIATPALAFYFIYTLDANASFTLSVFPSFGDLELLRVDKLAKVFGYIFTLNAFAGMIYAWYVRQHGHLFWALTYIGCGIGVVFAGDIITWYIYWELMAVTSTFLILTRRTKQAYGAGLRYLLVHLFGGLLLLAGILIQFRNTGSLAFETFTEVNLGTCLMLAGVLVNAAAPPFGSWLPDAYPSSSVIAGVILSAYTTKTAVYTLLRGFAGWEILILIGCIMTVYGIIYALLENDMRRILAYSIINQVGFMVAGAGIGTQMAINGAAAHAFCHIIYKSLLWMSAGAVLHRIGKSKCTDLGGLYKTMPLTMILGTIGALAISAVPLTSGFTSKTLILQASANQHMFWVWLVLEIASAGVFLHAGIKFPYFVFFAKDKGMRPKEAPPSMLIAMGILAFLCIFLGIYPDPLYSILPYPVDYHAYSAAHVVTQSQLLIFSALVFFLMLPLLKRTDTISLDSDWFYRKGCARFYGMMDVVLNRINAVAHQFITRQGVRSLSRAIPQLPGSLVAAIVRIGTASPGNAYGPKDLRAENARKSTECGSLPAGLGILLPLVLLCILIIMSL